MELFDNLSLSHLTNEYFAMIISTAYFPVFLPPQQDANPYVSCP